MAQRLQIPADSDESFDARGLKPLPRLALFGSSETSLRERLCRDTEAARQWVFIVQRSRSSETSC